MNKCTHIFDKTFIPTGYVPGYIFKDVPCLIYYVGGKNLETYQCAKCYDLYNEMSLETLLTLLPFAGKNDPIKDLIIKRLENETTYL